MKAILLAAGMGTRLAPITDFTPKCLIDINGETLLRHWLDLLIDNGVDEILINLSYLHKKVEEFLDSYQGPVIINRAFEKVLLGSAGTIRNNLEFIKDEQEFIIIYADNLTNMDLSKMIKYHRDKGSKFTIGLFMTNKPNESGIVTMDEMGVISEYIEKPEHPQSSFANAGIYIVDKSLLSIFSENSPFDIGKDVLPKLVGIMYGYYINSYYIDIGTMDNYTKALREWPSISKAKIGKE